MWLLRFTSTRFKASVLTVAALACGIVGGRPLVNREPPALDERGFDVEFSGCAAVVVGPVCELPANGPLRVWVKVPPEAVVFSTEGAALTSEVVGEIQGGALHRVIVPADARELRVSSKARTGAPPFVLRVVTKRLPSWLEEGRKLRQAGEVDRAAALAEEARTSPERTERAWALGLLARIELGRGRHDASFPLLREAIELHQQSGRVSDAADDSFALAFALNQRSHQYSEARSVLRAAHDLVASYPDGRAREAYYSGGLAMETGEPRTAVRRLAEARERAARLGLALLERNAINAHALQLEVLGRTREALATLARLEEELARAKDTSPCENVEVAINIGFGALVANEEAASLASLDAASPLERAAALCNSACKDPYLRTSALGNLALAALQRGRLVEARTRLADAKNGVTDPRGVEVLFWRDLEGRIALAEGDGQRALLAFEEECRLAEGLVLPHEQWRASVGRAEALEQLGRFDHALAEYRAAERKLSELSMLVPLGEGRGSYVGDRQRSARELVDLLVRLGRGDEALDVARRSRARVLVALEHGARLENLGPSERGRWERAVGAYRNVRAAIDAEAKDDWKLSRGEASHATATRRSREEEVQRSLEEAIAVLAEQGPTWVQSGLDPIPGDALTLAFHPVRHGWVGFAADGKSVTAVPLPDLPANAPPAALAEHLLLPFQARIAASKRLRVLPYGVLRSVDFHALPFHGRPLIATVPVEYPLDLPLAPAGAADPSSTLAVVVADPTLDLRSTRSEADHVDKALRHAGGWEIELLTGTRATSSALLPLLGGARLFHYAGHGAFAGREGWESALPLAGGGRLTLEDVLALTRAPRRVVLAGCETARTSADSMPEGLGIAQAFIIAGSDFVIAPVRIVDDALTARLASALYGGIASAGPVDAARELQHAQLLVESQGVASDWAAFRTLRR